MESLCIYGLVDNEYVNYEVREHEPRRRTGAKLYWASLSIWTNWSHGALFLSFCRISTTGTLPAGSFLVVCGHSWPFMGLWGS